MEQTDWVELLHATVAELLGTEPDELRDIGPEERMSDLGIDSLRLVSLVQRLDQAGCKVDFAAMMASPRLASWEKIVSGQSPGRAAGTAGTYAAASVRDPGDSTFRTGYHHPRWGPLDRPRPGYVPTPAAQASRYREEGWWTGRTLDQMLARSVDANPAKTAITDGRQAISYAELWRRADAVAQNLWRRGVRPGDHVICFLPNVLSFYPVYLGAVRLGAVPLLALPGHREAELTAFAETVLPKAVITVEQWMGVDYAETARSAAGSVTGTLSDIQVWTDLDRLCTSTQGPAVDRSGWGTHPEDVAFLLVSGGSTAVPKLIGRSMDGYGLTLELSNQRCGVTADTVYMAVLPLAHNYTNSSPGALGVLCAGGTVVLAEAPSPNSCLPLMEELGVDMVALVPPLAMLWADYFSHARTPDSLRSVLVGGAKLTPSSARRIEKVFPGALQQVYGMAEGLVCYTDLDDSREVRLSTQGRPLCPADELRVVDPDGCDVGRGESGELRVRGPYTISGYYRNPEATARAVDSDGYYCTGDLVRRTDSGSLVVEGRAVQVINRAGEKVLGEEVEDYLLQVDGVLDAVVVGQADELLGQRIVAYITLRPGSVVGESELRSFLRGSGLAAFKHPDRYELVDEIPATAVGKNDRSVLQKRGGQWEH